MSIEVEKDEELSEDALVLLGELVLRNDWVPVSSYGAAYQADEDAVVAAGFVEKRETEGIEKCELRITDTGRKKVAEAPLHVLHYNQIARLQQGVGTSSENGGEDVSRIHISNLCASSAFAHRMCREHDY